MAEPTTQVPDGARNVDPERPEEGRDALEAVIEAYGGDYADALEHTDELAAVFETAVLVVASADDDDVADVTRTLVTLIRAAEGVSGEGTVALAEGVGENADDLADLLDDVARLQAAGHLSKFAQVAAALAGPLDQDDADRLAETVAENADDVADALDAVMALQRAGQLEPLLETAAALSTVDVDESSARGLNTVLAAVGEAEERAEPVGLVGVVRRLAARDVRAGLGYLLGVVEGIGRRVR